jgi:hypothetical protein
MGASALENIDCPLSVRMLVAETSHERRFLSEGLALAPLVGRPSGALGGAELVEMDSSKGGGTPFRDACGGLPCPLAKAGLWG